MKWATVARMRSDMQGFVFYFDLIGMQSRLLDDLGRAIEQLENFQRLVRERAELHVPGGTLITLADNIWARIHEDESKAVADVVSHTLRAAYECGFNDYFGAVTFGRFDRDIGDAALVTGGDPTDIRKQHIGMTSDPHLRAAMAEKWSAHLAKAGALPVAEACIWISEEVRPALVPLPRKAEFDLATLPIGGKTWPFPQSKFTAVVRK